MTINRSLLESQQSESNAKSKMALVHREAQPTDDYDEEAEDRDEFHIAGLAETFINEEESIRHDQYPESDEDEEEAGRKRDTNFRRGDGSLFKNQTFYSGVAFKEAVTDYVKRLLEFV